MKTAALHLLWIVVGIVSSPAMSQEAPWPNRPIRVIVPLGPGSAADASGRVVLELLAKQLGQPIIVENRPGAGGTVGTALVAHAKPDGYTLLVTSNSYTVVASTYKQLSYDPARDLVGVAPLALTPLVFVTASSKGIHNMLGLIELAKAKPGSFNYASAGTGTATQLGAERLRIAAGFTGTHIPLKSTAEALTEVLAGRVDYFLSPIGLAKPYVQTGRLVALAVSSSKRSNAIPDVPTTAEAGLPNAEYETWMGMFAPSKTPRDIIDRLSMATARVLRSPELQTRFDTLVMSPLIMSPEEFSAFIKKDFELNAQLVMAAGLLPQ
jgi:tripartite-type tricarboxylate transporter receptor subunit TctC